MELNEQFSNVTVMILKDTKKCYHENQKAISFFPVTEVDKVFDVLSIKYSFKVCLVKHTFKVRLVKVTQNYGKHSFFIPSGTYQLLAEAATEEVLQKKLILKISQKKHRC